jgi:metal-dependent amidase/aminoacylase/carboxypeptidase family protein
MEKRFERIAEAAAMMTDTEVEIKISSGYKPGLPNQTLNKAYYELTEELGMNPIIPILNSEQKLWMKKRKHNHFLSGLDSPGFQHCIGNQAISLFCHMNAVSGQ